MDVSLLIRHRLKKLGLEQKDLAAAAQVTESYISQLLARKKTPPSPGRTEIYEKIGAALKLPSGELSLLADRQRKEQPKKRVEDLPQPLFLECRGLSGDATDEEVGFLKSLKLRGRRPSRIYYYRELQNLRDPLHFLSAAQPGEPV